MTKGRSDPPDLSKEEIQRYSRHLLIPDIGLAGQKKLKAASILVVGAGGLGSPVLLYLAAAGVGRIGIADGDSVDFTNLQRQVIHSESRIGDLKIRSARDRMLDINSEITVDLYPVPLTSENAFEIAEPYDIIVDCSDNFPTRYLVNDLSVLTGKPNVYGSIYRVDGQASVFNADGGPCYRCIFPEPPPPELVPPLGEGGILGVLPGTIGTIQATEAVKLVLGIGTSLSGTLLLYDALEMSFETVRLQHNQKCKVCSDHPEVRELIDYEDFCGMPAQEDQEGSAGVKWDITPAELEKKLQDDEAVHLIDVREPHEQEISNIAGSEVIPLGEITARMSELDSAEEIVLFCKSGTRSIRALQILTGGGFRKVKNLKGGINAWAREVDDSLPVY